MRKHYFLYLLIPTVNGDIHAKEIKVDLNGAVVPDYVSGEDNELHSSEEIQAHIKEKRHYFY
ncbi:hypothetical protein OOZ15_10405 [Galbibacter sp. EGI 63066]|uniref:hypothetical protein n=1 Tax=Galbibacter sp. EGI 63066 TaxID=2993559 RepID=UPI002248F5F2|nr:hypothetical protein [Galbibacter sp. EGI 63066]MCX2680352.1 hypothetical protein [Galbibacter sp. EGI 63066]